MLKAMEEATERKNTIWYKPQFNKEGKQMRNIVARLADTETTGTGASDQVIELAYLEMERLENYSRDKPLYANEFPKYQERFKPDVEINPFAFAVHGISAEQLVDCRPSVELVFPDTEYLIGHNIGFDHKMMGTAAPQSKQICTLKLARQLWKKGTDVTDHKLTTLIEELVPGGAELVKEAHSALSDCQLTLIVLHLILEKLPRVSTWEELYLLQAGKESKPKAEKKLPETMPFGAHIGEKLTDIPQDYLRWCLKNIELRAPLKEAMENIVGKQ